LEKGRRDECVDNGMITEGLPVFVDKVWGKRVATNRAPHAKGNNEGVIRFSKTQARLGLDASARRVIEGARQDREGARRALSAGKPCRSTCAVEIVI
jgi:hypothetical protein